MSLPENVKFRAYMATVFAIGLMSYSAKNLHELVLLQIRYTLEYLWELLIHSLLFVIGFNLMRYINVYYKEEELKHGK
ncbi:MAG: hypothetical protein LW817_04195 [Candidatus Caenarcaniphilales bacterium]|jgi:hypothetical protein|nr:hypothetical protein [Candidatus Caenarcaniphilales bacterium]